jgi:polysaccharide transporter, PST family
MTYVIPMIVLPYLVRVLGMEMYGLMAFAQSFAQYFTVVTDYGFNFSATRSIAQNKDDHGRTSRLFCSVYLIKLALTAAGAIILGLVATFLPRFHSEARFFFAAYIAVAGNALFPTWYFQGIERMRYISVIVGLSRLGGAICLFVFVHSPKDALLAVLIQSGASVVSGVVGASVAIGTFRFQLIWPTVAMIRETLADGWHLFLSSSAMALYTNTNVFLVGVLAGNVDAGYFSAAEKLLRAMQGLILPAVQAAYPHMNSLRVQSRELALRFIRRSLRWIGGVTLIPSLVLFFFAGPITLLCFGKGATGSVPVVRWIAFLPVLSAISNVLGIMTMIPFGLDKQFSRIVIFAGLINIAIGIPLVTGFGAAGAGASILLTELFVASGVFIQLDRHDLHVLRMWESAA